MLYTLAWTCMVHDYYNVPGYYIFKIWVCRRYYPKQWLRFRFSLACGERNKVLLSDVKHSADCWLAAGWVTWRSDLRTNGVLDRRAETVLRVGGTESFRPDDVCKQQVVSWWTLCSRFSCAGNQRSAALRSRQHL